MLGKKDSSVSETTCAPHLRLRHATYRLRLDEQEVGGPQAEVPLRHQLRPVLEDRGRLQESLLVPPPLNRVESLPPDPCPRRLQTYRSAHTPILQGYRLRQTAWRRVPLSRRIRPH